MGLSIGPVIALQQFSAAGGRRAGGKAVLTICRAARDPKRADALREEQTGKTFASVPPSGRNCLVGDWPLVLEGRLVRQHRSCQCGPRSRFDVRRGDDNVARRDPVAQMRAKIGRSGNQPDSWVVNSPRQSHTTRVGG